MPLSRVRDMFVEATGRADLVSSGTALSADFLINEGQKYLDRKLGTGKALARYFVDLSCQQILVQLLGCRTIKKLFCSDSTSRWELTKVDYDNIRKYYNQPISQITTGRPTLYAPVCVRPFPNDVDSTLFAQAWALSDIIESGHENFNGVIVMPPPDADSAYTLEVYGLFASDELVHDDDVSYWTEQNPLLLVKAAAYQLESIYRNTEGMKDWDLAIEKDLFGIIADHVEEEIADINSMEG